MARTGKHSARKRKPTLRPVPTDVAVDTLGRGGVVLAPTESVFGLAVDACSDVALRSLWLIKGEDPQPLAWHIASEGPVMELLERVKCSLSVPQHRIIRRLTPGPLLLAIELELTQLEQVRTALNVGPNVVDDGTHVLVRIVSHPAAASLLEAFDGAVVMSSLPGHAAARDLTGAIQALDEQKVLERVTAAVDGPPSPKGVGSTTVVFARDGGFSVTREGVYERRFVEKQARQLVVFVCSGNTCRSPMAEAIARQIIKEASASVEVDSAGVFASTGAPATSEAVHAVRALGIPMHRHTAQQASRELMRRADVVFVMTSAHADTARRFDADGATSIQLLDPSGRDIDDPVGQPQGVYDATAAKMRAFIEQRFAELGFLKPSPASGA